MVGGTSHTHDHSLSSVNTFKSELELELKYIINKVIIYLFENLFKEKYKSNNNIIIMKLK